MVLITYFRIKFGKCEQCKIVSKYPIRRKQKEPKTSNKAYADYF